MPVTSYDITPVPKPRQSRRDRWAERACVLRYRAFADEVRLKKVYIPTAGYHILFYLPMPASWSKKKRCAMANQPHQQKPDKDNLEKALLDAVYGDDACVWDGRVSKLWGHEGRIVVIYDANQRVCRTDG